LDGLVFGDQVRVPPPGIPPLMSPIPESLIATLLTKPEGVAERERGETLPAEEARNAIGERPVKFTPPIRLSPKLLMATVEIAPSVTPGKLRGVRLPVEETKKAIGGFGLTLRFFPPIIPIVSP